jgi:hypothetical protein
MGYTKRAEFSPTHRTPSSPQKKLKRKEGKWEERNEEGLDNTDKTHVYVSIRSLFYVTTVV